MALKVILSILVVLVVSVTAEDPEKAPLLAGDSPTKIKDEYIVVLKEELSDEEVEGHKKMVRTAMKLQGNFSKIAREYNIGKGFRGYHAVADQRMVETLRTMAAIKYIEHNQEMHAYQGDNCVCKCGAEWGLHRTVVYGDAFLKEGEFYTYPEDEAGEGVDVYIIDTGIYTEHNDFGGRAFFGIDYTGEGAFDGDGHGTHVAGTVIGNTFGLARKATAIAVKVLDSNGSGYTSDVIAGVNWVAEQHSAHPYYKSVANMSLGGGKSSSLNSAVENAIKAGVHFAVAAGNEAQNACNYSPASSTAVTVASVGQGQKSGEQIESNIRSYFSNFGKCVDIFAPGSAITSAWIYSKSSTNTISGTSMASPHVAGVMAKILSKSNISPEAIKAKLQEEATPGIVVDDKGTPNNLLLYHGCGTSKSCC